MVMLPKDHKPILAGRPLVSATDGPGTMLSQILAELLKHFLSFVPCHLNSTKMFTEALCEFFFNNDTHYFGSFDVVNLCGSILLDGDNSLFNVVSIFFIAQNSYYSF